MSLLQKTVPTELALKFYDKLDQLRAPRFANCRLHLPCISSRVTEIRRRRGLAQHFHHVWNQGIRAPGPADYH
ncbi:hypothetical protein BDR07DRAFT_1408704 [Suillus spraguei]|nr:hypothetical protein BDR07DRAFT_1412775 [Suillus spraguei]KAG2360357.1 hypothetical protein BDR07DRAFT_1412786 [Suillus spraguei]KAG2361798.1 hypothetical protein BDR07DRAFT_1408694 [Suillus spraguei]KAG2361804.1 hypothetical protein BDR07DRAFT_1408704 [Suillus spraguei]